MKKIPAVFAAMDDEIKDFKSKVVSDERIHLKSSLIVRCQFRENACILVRSGIGKRAMSRALEYVALNFDIGGCVNVGYCGGTKPDLNAGDIVLASFVVDSETKKVFKVDEELVKKADNICKKKGLKVFIGGIASVDEVVRTPHEKAFVGTENEVAAIDMESSAFMERSLGLGKSAFVIRVVLDPMDMVLPDVGDIIDSDGEISMGQAAYHFISRPKDILSIPKIEYCARKARESITKFLEGWTESL